jgi:transposase
MKFGSCSFIILQLSSSYSGGFFSVKGPEKYASELTEEESALLKTLHKESCDSRVRRRAHIILLSSKGYSINELSDIFDVKRDTVSARINAWEKYGPTGLKDSDRSGRPPKLNASDTESAAEIIRQSPQNPRQITARIQEALNIKISASTLKRTVKKLNLRWKRTRTSLKHLRDENEFQQTEAEIRELSELHRSGIIDLFFSDQSGFQIGSYVPYAYQPVGETLEIPGDSRKRLNVMGFFSPDNRLISFTFECTINSDAVIACFDEFVKQTTKTSVAVIDNAPMHHSTDFCDKINEWAEKGLFIMYLPPYSPELNKIEILWKFIKYSWIEISAYLSYENLVKQVEYILKNVGSKFCIDFS